MPSSLRLLILEDRSADAELMLLELRRAGFTADWQRVETEADYIAALDPALDLILADYSLPQFNALRALQLLQQRGPDIPFIIVTGSISEETAVECMKLGAADYLLKDRLTRLGQAVTHALDQKRLRTEKRQAEQALVDNERLFRALIEHSSDVVTLLDAAGRIVYASRSVTPILGYALEDYVGRNSFDLVHPDDVAVEQQDFLRLQQTPRATVDLAVRFRHHDGTWRQLEGTATNLLDEAGVKAVVVNFRDVTDRKQAEEQREAALEARRVAEERYHAIFESVIDGIFWSRAEGHFLTVNPAFARMLGYASPEEMLALITNIGEQVYLETPHRAEFMRLMEEQGSVAGFEFQMRRKDGSTLWVSENARAVRDAEGHIRYYEGTVQDITLRKQAEFQREAALEALKRSEHVLSLFVEHAPAAIAMFDRDMRYMAASNRYLADYRLGDQTLVGRSHYDIFPEIPERWKEIHRRCLAGAIEACEEDPFPRADGGLDWVRWEIHPWHERSGVIGGLLLFSEVITERKRVESLLHDKVAALQTLAEIDREIIAATEPANVLELVCDRATELMRVPMSAVALRPAAGGEMTIAASRGLRDLARVNEEFGRAWQPARLRQFVAPRREAFGVNDLQTAGAPSFDTENGEEVRAVALAPLVAGEEMLGAFGVFDIIPHAWTADELLILSMLAGQVAVTLEKIRLFQAARDRALYLSTLNEIGQAITSSLDLDRVLITLLDKARRAADGEACSVALVDLPTGELVFRQAVGGSSQLVIGMRVQPGQGIAGWAFQQRQSARVVEVATDPRFYQLTGSDYAIRDLVCVPLLARNTAIGVLELINKRHGTFSEDDVHLLESVAAQAAVAIENARLFETEHTGRERLETLYRIGQAINSTLDADTILERLTDEAMQATQATHGSALVARPERGCFERRSLRGYSMEQAEKARVDWLPLDRGINGRVYQSKQAIVVDDVHLEPDYHLLIPETRAELAVPIMRSGQVIGNLDLQSPIERAFHHIDLQFLKALTDQVAIALENARLFEETHRQMDELTIVSQVALVGAAGRPFDETVARATDALSRLWPQASLGFLFIDETSQALRMHKSYLNPPPGTDPADSLPLEAGLTGWAARQQRPMRVGDITADPRYVAQMTTTRSEMAAPLVVGERVIGVVNVETSWVDAFSGDDLRLLTTLAGQLAVVFEKARLDAALIEHTVLLEQRAQERTAEIRQQQARTQAILDAVGEGVVMTDVKGVIQYVNPATEVLTGFEGSECLGQNPRLWKSGRTPLEVYREMWNTILAGETWRGEVSNRRKSGAVYNASLTIAPIPATRSGQLPAGFVGVQRDITTRKQAEEEMLRALEKERELSTLKSRFVSLTSHEFRTPLTAILSSAEMLEYYGPTWTEERKGEHLRRIQAGVKYMTSLLDDILIIGKADAGKLEFSPKRLDVLQYCRDLVEELGLIDKGRHTLKFEGPSGSIPARVDETLLRHILSNVLSNALKYSPPGSAVQFELAQRDDQVVFRIQDQGIGIPPDDLAHLFETFHRASNARNIAGTGLGMAIVKRSVDLHGGTIEVASEVGAGTTVTVALPLNPSQGSLASASR